MNAIRGMELELQGGEARLFTHLVMDFTGTLSRDGVLLTGIAERINRLAGSLSVIVLTADTFGTARQQLEHLSVETVFIRTGKDKAGYVRAKGSSSVIAIGNGRNDVLMIREAGLGIAVIGPEGASAELVAGADIVVCDPCDALDLLIHPLRLKAVLRD